MAPGRTEVVAAAGDGGLDFDVLVVGSGHMTHGLPFLTREMFTENEVPGWSADFDAWAADALARGAVDELARFRTSAPG